VLLLAANKVPQQLSWKWPEFYNISVCFFKDDLNLYIKRSLGLKIENGSFYLFLKLITTPKTFLKHYF